MAREMKDSGIEWVGEIPQSWEVRPVKDVLLFMSRGTQPTYASDTDFFITNQACLSTYQLRPEKKKECEPIFGLRGRYKFGDVLVASTGEGVLGKCVLSEEAGYCDSHVSILRPKKLDTGKFIFYWLSANYNTVNSLFSKGSTKQTEFQKDPFLAFKIGFPPLSEQRAIADYLDQQTALIDQRLSTLEEKKAVLAELRKATIHEAVTQGARWNAVGGQIENLPNGWEATQAKRLLCFITSGSRGWAEYYADEGDIFLRIGNLTRETIELDLDDVQYVRLPVNATEGSRTRIREGDMLVSITADLGSIAIAPKLDKPAYVNQHIALCRPKSSVLPRWLGYAMVSSHTKQQFMNSGYGGTKIQLSLDDVRHVWLGVPPPAEQLAIANHLDQQTQHIAAQLATLDEQAQVLKELRKAIIHEAVTGKIDLSGT